jgi:V-type H+-transporting ATPase subunit D
MNAGPGLTGLGKGGQQILKCRDTFTKAVETLIQLASLQVRFHFIIKIKFQ